MKRINIFCDETCHLEKDHRPSMGFGAISCPQAKLKFYSNGIQRIKKQHGLDENLEIKWTKVSPAKLSFYKELIDFFLDKPDLEFRALIIPDKSKLDHQKYGSNHDDYYFKMYYQLIHTLLDPSLKYNIFLDIKDTRSHDKVQKLGEFLRASKQDFNKSILENIQTIRSHESQLLQICDLLLGAICAANRLETHSQAKIELINHIRNKTNYSLVKSTLLREKKINILIWRSKEDMNNA